MLVVPKIHAQHDAQFTQYMFVPSVYNPGYVGSRAVLSVLVLNRSQWVGLEGSPTTSIFSAHLPLENYNLGLGFDIVNDNIGPTVNNNFAANISYTLNTSDNFKLAFGLKFSADFWTIDFTKLHIFNQNDVLLNHEINNKFTSNVGAGIYWYAPKFYAGLSVPKILDASFYRASETKFSQISKHFNLMSGYVFNFSDNLLFKPATNIKIARGAPVQIELSANFLVNNKFTFGTSYRFNAAITALAGFQINNNWLIGYSNDVDCSKLINYNFGSHEIFLRYEFTKTYKKVYSPRFF